VHVDFSLLFGFKRETGLCASRQDAAAGFLHEMKRESDKPAVSPAGDGSRRFQTLYCIPSRVGFQKKFLRFFIDKFNDTHYIPPLDGFRYPNVTGNKVPCFFWGRE